MVTSLLKLDLFYVENTVLIVKFYMCIFAISWRLLCCEKISEVVLHFEDISKYRENKGI